jgi:hypothetical protein
MCDVRFVVAAALVACVVQGAAFGRREGATAVLSDVAHEESTLQVGFIAAGDLSKYLDVGLKLMHNINSVTAGRVHFHILTDGRTSAVHKILGARTRAVYSVHEFRDLGTRDKRVYKGLSSTVEGYKAEVATLYVYKLMLHRLLPTSVNRLILMDLDMFVLSDMGALWREFDNFSPEHLFGMAIEQQPTYHNCWKSDQSVAEFGPHGFWGWNGG